MTQYDPRNKLATAHKVLYSLMHDRSINEFPMGVALNEMDDFIAFLDDRKGAHPVILQVKDLLTPGRKIIEVHLSGDFSIKEVVEFAFDEFNRAIKIIGNLLEKKLPDQYAWSGS